MTINRAKIGQIGEEIAVRYLKSNGYLIIERNFDVCGIGEMDIIAAKDDILHFIEVKTSENTNIFDEFHSIRHFDTKKKERIIRAMEKFCFTRNITNMTRCVDLIAVSLDPNSLKASIVFEENVYMSTI